MPPVSIVRSLAPPDWSVRAPSPLKVAALIVDEPSNVPEVEAILTPVIVAPVESPLNQPGSTNIEIKPVPTSE